MGFDPDNFLHNRGNLAEVVEVSGQGHCVLDAGGYIFNTEAHPIDPAALACCSGLSEKEVQDQLAGHMVDILNPGSVKEWQGDLVPERLRNLEKKRGKEAKERKQREKQAREKLEQLRQQAHAAAAEVKRQDEEKRRVIRERRENGSIPGISRMETSQDTDLEEGEEEEGPQFSGKQVEELKTSEGTKPSENMITMVSRGEVEVVGGETQPVKENQSPGIVQPDKKANVFKKKSNMLVNA